MRYWKIIPKHAQKGILKGILTKDQHMAEVYAKPMHAELVELVEEISEEEYLIIKMSGDFVDWDKASALVERRLDEISGSH
jgi:hypothetical protein